MRYTTEVTLAMPRGRVIELFDSTENLCKWQVGLKSFRGISGDPGQEGSRSELVYEGRKGDLIMTETITNRNLPHEFHGVYEARGIHNELQHYFYETPGGGTLWRSVNILRFRGLMALMAPFMKPAFKSNTLLSMERFRSFAEKSVSN